VTFCVDRAFEYLQVLCQSIFVIVDVRDYKYGRGIYEGESIIIRSVGIFFVVGYTAGWA
jgi:hypothetical protein